MKKQENKTDLFHDYNDLPEELDVAMEKITLDIFNNLDYGCQINLTEKYALYKYSEDDMIVVYTEVVDLSNAKKALENAFPNIIFELDEISYFAKDSVTLTGEEKEKFAASAKSVKGNVASLKELNLV